MYQDCVSWSEFGGPPFPGRPERGLLLGASAPASCADGKLIKGDLAKVFVLGKGEGWGQEVPDNLKNGNWVFAAYGSDGKALAEDFAKCRACHAARAVKDFEHRYDEYFEKRPIR